MAGSGGLSVGVMIAQDFNVPAGFAREEAFS
jgi:hypothetical protein